jgi:hypothetical protein
MDVHVFILLLGSLAGSLIFFAVRIGRARGDRRLARKVEGANPWMEERLLSQVELLEEVKRRDVYSSFLLSRLEGEVRGLIGSRDVALPIAFGRGLRRVLLGGILIFLLSLVANPAGFARAFRTMQGKGLTTTEHIMVWPGDAKVFTDSTLRIMAKVMGDSLSRPSLHIGGEIRTMRPREGRFEAEIRGADPDMKEYFVQSERGRSDLFDLTAVDRPYVDSLVARVEYPSYTGLKPEEFLSPPVLSPLEGSRVRFRGKAKGADSVLVYVENDLHDLQREGIEFDFELTTLAPSSVRFRLMAENLWTESPQAVLVRPLEDHPPEIVLLEPRGDVTLSEETEIPILGLIEDDFGLRRAELVYAFKGQESRRELVTYRYGHLFDSLSTFFDLSDLFLLPGEELVFHVRVSDWKGQEGRSREVRVRFPTLEEIYQAMDGTGEASISTAEDLKEKLEALSEKAQAIEDLLKEEKDLDFGMREQLEQLMAEEEQLIGELGKMNESLEQALEQLESAPLLDRQVLEKMREVGELMQEIMTEEMQESLEKLREALEAMKPMDVQAALEHLQRNQEEVLQNLERFAEMLKRITQENELLRMAEAADRLKEAQEDLARRTEGCEGAEECAELAKEQEALERERKALEEAMKALAEELAESDPQVSEVLEEMADIDMSEISRSMSEASSAMAQGKKSSAGGKQNKSAKSLESLSKKLRSLHGQMMAARLAQAMAELTGLRRRALFLAERQRELVDALEGLERRTDVDPFELAVLQDGIRGGADLVLREAIAIAEKSFFLGPKIVGPIAGSARSMLEASNMLGQLATGKARSPAKDALLYMDLAVLAMLDAQSKMQCSGGCSGLQEALDALAKMAQRQASLSFGTQSLFPLPSPIPASLQGQLQRLAEEQEALRKALEGLRAGLSEEGLERSLEGAEKEMEEVVRRLSERHVDADLLDKQRRILSRLLDAQKSIRKREFSKTRISETGKEYDVVSPKELPPEGNRERIRRALLDVRRGEYPVEYRRLIEAYFETLLDATP